MALAVGIPKEMKPGERRVGLTPQGVRTLRTKGIRVFVEKGAGELSGFQNQEYRDAGAELVSSGKELWQKADLIKKVKEPIQDEFGFFQSRHIIFTYLHLASPEARPLIEALRHSKAAAIGYETIEVKGETPLLKPMSEVAGVLAAYFAAIIQNHVTVQNTQILGLEKAKPIMEEVAGIYPSVPEHLPLRRVVIIGGGHVGEKAARMACAMGGVVTLCEISEARRRNLDEAFQAAGLKVSLVRPEDRTSFEPALASSDCIIAAVHAPGKRAPLILDATVLKRISAAKKKLILDIAIDQGGNVAESRPVDYENPLYLDSFGNLRFSVTNVPSLCGRGASLALEKVSLGYTEALVQGVDAAVKQYPELKTGINVFEGRVIHTAVSEAHGFDRKF